MLQGKYKVKIDLITIPNIEEKTKIAGNRTCYFSLKSIMPL